MLGVFIFILFIGLGIGSCYFFLFQYPLYIRIWIGTLAGVLGLMWGVIPFSFFLDFSIASHIFAFIVMLGLLISAIQFHKQQKKMTVKSDKVLNSLLFILIPIFLLTVMLLNSHVLSPGNNGSLSVGQSTFGDLCLHLGITSSIANQGTFPPDYSIFPGQRLSYPFLVNSLSSSLYLFGTPLRWAILIPSYILAAALITGFFLFSYEVLNNRHKAVFASAIFFLNGGFGFIYFVDDLKKNKTNFTRLFTEFYKTPTNHVEKNIKWVNVLCDMIIPQRTTLAGWTFLFLALWLLYRAIHNEDRKLFVLAGIVAGLMPMIHTHSFLGLGIISMTWSVVYFFQYNNKKLYLHNWLYFAGIAAVLSLPQLFYWTFPQSTGEGFLRWKFDWANDTDYWIWFWVKNVGIVFILTIPALIAANKKLISFYSGALLLFVVAEIIVFQPNPYDNNKLFYIWYAFSAILATGFLWEIFDKMKGIRGRWILLVLVFFFSTFSGVLSIAREKVSSYVIFDQNAVAASNFIKKNTPNDALFITSDNHNNPVASLTGRNVVSGTPVYLNFHGVNYSERAREVETMYQNPSSFKLLADKYEVDYVYLSNYERNKFKVDDTYFKENYSRVFQQGDVSIYAISERAKKLIRDK